MSVEKQALSGESVKPNLVSHPVGNQDGKYLMERFLCSSYLCASMATCLLDHCSLEVGQRSRV